MATALKKTSTPNQSRFLAPSWQQVEVEKKSNVIAVDWPSLRQPSRLSTLAGFEWWGFYDWTTKHLHPTWDWSIKSASASNANVNRWMMERKLK